MASWRRTRSGPRRNSPIAVGRATGSVSSSASASSPSPSGTRTTPGRSSATSSPPSTDSHDLESFFRGLYAVGALWALGLVVLAAPWSGGGVWRDMAIGGVAAGARPLHRRAVVENASLKHALDVTTRIGDDSPASRRCGRRDRRGDLGGVALPPAPCDGWVRSSSCSSPCVDVPRNHVARRPARRRRPRVEPRRAGAPRVRIPGGRPTTAQVQSTLVELGVRGPRREAAADATQHRHRDVGAHARASSRSACSAATRPTRS